MITDREMDILQIEVQDYMMRLLEEYEIIRQGNRVPLEAGRGEVGNAEILPAQEVHGESGGQPTFNSQGLGDNISAIIGG